MTVRRFARALRRRAWLPLLTAAVAVLGTAALTVASSPAYTAQATVIANSPSNGSARALGFTDVVDSNTLLASVVRSLGLPDSPTTLSQRISVTGDRSSNLYHITVTDSDPQRAAAIANEVAADAATLYTQLGSGADQPLPVDTSSQDATYLGQYQAAAQALSAFEQQNPNAAASGDPAITAQELRLKLAADTAAAAYQNFHNGLIQSQVGRIQGAKDFDARVVDRAVPGADGSGRRQRIIVAGALGLALGAGAVVVLELLDRSLRDPEEIERLVGAPVVGLIGHADERRQRAEGSM
jgi:polysaccharide biosynthesis transport protein